jgi:hypothetical protein
MLPRCLHELESWRHWLRNLRPAEVGKVNEFEFVQVTDEVVRYWVRILFRNEQRYGGYYVNDDGSDIRVPN